MDSQQLEFVVISLGGSIVIPEEIDVSFLRAFRETILREVQNGKRFALIIGGGKTCRKYQKAASELSELTNEDLDWIGIYATHLNAHFMRYVFKDATDNMILTDPSQFTATDKSIIIGASNDKPIIIGAGYEPGGSTDVDAVLVAKKFGAKTVINLSNIDYVYDGDPKSNPQAKPIERISWKEYRKVIPRDWVSGMNTPFDPVASRQAEKLGLAVIIMNGRNTDNLSRYLQGESFKGTVIS